MSLGWEGSGARSSIFLGRVVFTSVINTPHPPQTAFTPLDLTPLTRALWPSAAATSIVAGEEELHCLDLVTAVLAPAVEIFTPPPPELSSAAKLGRGRPEQTNFSTSTPSLSCSSSRVIKLLLLPSLIQLFSSKSSKGVYSSNLHTLNTSHVICSWFVSLSIIFLQDSSIVWIFDLYNSRT